MTDPKEAAFIELMEKHLSNTINNDVHHYIKTIAIWISKIFIQETRTTITHAFDPPWDNSGISVETEDAFVMDNYSDLCSFIYEEYTGNSTPSYISGSGLFHDTYEVELQDITDQWIQARLKKSILKLIDSQNNQFLDYISEQLNQHPFDLFNDPETTDQVLNWILESDILGDCLAFTFPYSVIQKVEKMNLHYLYKLGYKEAAFEIKQEELEKKKKHIQAQKEVEIAKKSYSYLCNLHQMRYARPMPAYIDKTCFNKFVKSLLEEQFSNDETKHSIHLIGKYLSHHFSNSVAYEFIHFNQNRN